MSGTKVTTPVNLKPQTSCLVNQCFYYTVTALNISIQSVIWVYKSLFHFRLSRFPLFLPSSPPSCDLTSLSGDGEDDAGTPLHSSYVARNAVQWNLRTRDTMGPTILSIETFFHRLLYPYIWSFMLVLCLLQKGCIVHHRAFTVYILIIYTYHKVLPACVDISLWLFPDHYH